MYLRVSRTLLRILSDINYTLHWIVLFTSSNLQVVLISFPRLSDPFGYPQLLFVPPCIRSSVVVFFIFLELSKYFFICSLPFLFTHWFDGMVKSMSWKIMFFSLIKYFSGLLSGIVWSFCISKSHILRVSISWR